MSSLLPYHEPSISTILKQSSFLLVLNTVNHVLDSWIYAGLVGQILVGVAWGLPGGQILKVPAQEVIVELGYIGLILLVFEGGLSTSFSALKANIGLSTLVALTGIVAPMGLSFILSPMIGASSFQAFAAGAALCSTSLGTTFTLLSTSGLSSSRLGVVLTSAAMMDDVVGLIMVQVISNFGSSSSFDAVTVIRPILVSLGLALLLPLFCRFIVLPMTKLVFKSREARPSSLLNRLLQKELAALCLCTSTLIAIVAGATYAGSSALLGAYIAGAMISWWDAEASQLKLASSSIPPTGGSGGSQTEGVEISSTHDGPETQGDEGEARINSHSGSELFEKYYEPVLHRVFKPLFFASVGFSIPITKMFSGSVIWRGLVYTVLMMVGKLICGLWLLRLPNPLVIFKTFARVVDRVIRRKRMRSTPSRRKGKKSSASPEKPLSVYPGLILGSAMVARGEIGYLISSLAEGGGVFRNAAKRAAAAEDEPSETFLIITWAITLCTIAGPVTMGLLVDRVRRLERGISRNGQDTQRANVLGSWGVNSAPVS